ncbi:hypothetical protein DWW90_08435 [Parabacteroides sp. AF17-28]|nr:hypothetical protein DWW90_08435 [Parabacteroides sp. AF17-28]
MHSIGLTNTPNELLYPQTNPTSGGFLCLQRHSKIYFQLLRDFPVTENPCTAVGRIILRSRIISKFFNRRLDDG